MATTERVVQVEVGGLSGEIATAVVEALDSLSERLVTTQQALTEMIRFVAAQAASTSRDHETTVEAFRALAAATANMQAAAKVPSHVPSRKTITFERDPLTRRMTSAQVEEVTTDD